MQKQRLITFAIMISSLMPLPLYAQTLKAPKEATLHRTEEPAVAQNIDYLSGGIGTEGREMMKEAQGSFNTRLLFADFPTGAYLSDVTVTVLNNKGEVLLQEVSEGPYFFLMLPEGSYTLKAVHHGVEQMQKVTVSKTQVPGQIKWVWKNQNPVPEGYEIPENNEGARVQ